MEKTYTVQLDYRLEVNAEDELLEDEAGALNLAHIMAAGVSSSSIKAFAKHLATEMGYQSDDLLYAKLISTIHRIRIDANRKAYLEHYKEVGECLDCGTKKFTLVDAVSLRDVVTKEYRCDGCQKTFKANFVLEID